MKKKQHAKLVSFTVHKHNFLKIEIKTKNMKFQNFQFSVIQRSDDCMQCNPNEQKRAKQGKKLFISQKKMEMFKKQSTIQKQSMFKIS